ncbi:MAG: hypothetical protein POELPBGB_01020 [Bacteroidia bacterium]|nr:hypothetical protein [Bacteroidia bacterium]
MTTLSNLSPSSRIWIYQSSREFTPAEVQQLNTLATEFVITWSAHGAALKAAAEILHNRFLVIGVDEEQAAASGCSIDKSVALVKKIEADFNTNLLDRMQIAYRSGNEIKTFKLPQASSLLEKAELTENTVIFNNLVSTKKDWDQKWEVALKDSWILQTVN